MLCSRWKEACILGAPEKEDSCCLSVPTPNMCVHTYMHVLPFQVWSRTQPESVQASKPGSWDVHQRAHKCPDFPVCGSRASLSIKVVWTLVPQSRQIALLPLPVVGCRDEGPVHPYSQVFMATTAKLMPQETLILHIQLVKVKARRYPMHTGIRVHRGQSPLCW